jgi:hypothetical protein
MNCLLKTGCFVLLLLFFSNCTLKYGIKRSYAFSRESVAGTVPVDQDNHPLSSGVSRMHLIYIETAKDAPPPVWQNAWTGKEVYSIQAIEIKEPQLDLGKSKSGKDIVIKRKEGRRLWQLMLTLVTGRSPGPALSELIQKNAIVLTGTWKDQEITYTISREEELPKLFME